MRIVILVLLFVVCLFYGYEAMAQVGCCQNPGGNCVPAFSNDGSGTPPQNSNQSACEGETNGSGMPFEWFAGVTCVPSQNCPGFVPPTPTPTPTPTASPSPSPSASPTAEPTGSPTPTAEPTGTPTPVPAGTTSVPTINQWGLIFTAGMLLVFGFIVARRMRKIKN